ncbi:YheT family hydrolase [Reichenbachiella sp.]|uniref:YheT family hydrolase n=1 Tax=Reichenbachiella sp. TaxID=2184521 RepID=UPI003BB0E85A
MPIIHSSDYQRPKLLFNRHLETIIPGITRKVKNLPSYERIRIDTPDQDFLDLDWYQSDSDKLLILSHGLEGDSHRPYIEGMVKKFHGEGWNVIAWNYRGCSGEMNNTSRFYHSGATQDLKTMVDYALTLDIPNLTLGGFSLGGNLTLKYLGEEKRDPKIKSAFAFSVPIDLKGCCHEIDKPHNFLYCKRFLKSLKVKGKAKNEKIPGSVDVDELMKVENMYQFDNVVTAPLHGFDSADDYYAKCSARNFIEGIEVPTLLVNALNDPFLSESCFDQTKFESSKNVYFEMPKFGGHVGFSSNKNNGTFWSEDRAFRFIDQL